MKYTSFFVGIVVDTTILEFYRSGFYIPIGSQVTQQYLENQKQYSFKTLQNYIWSLCDRILKRILKSIQPFVMVLKGLKYRGYRTKY